MFALSEAYPNLKANENFQQLQMELTDLENKIAASRRFFNNAVQEYNTGIQRFPAALFAGALGFTEKQFFDLGAERQAVGEAPQVKFEPIRAPAGPSRARSKHPAWRPTVSTATSNRTSGARSRC